jgi:hypothetical protein
MPHRLEEIIQTLAELRRTTPDLIQQTVHRNFVRLVQDDPWLPGRYTRLLSGHGSA